MNPRTSFRREHLTPETSQTQLNKQGPRKIKAFALARATLDFWVLEWGAVESDGGVTSCKSIHSDEFRGESESLSQRKITSL